MHGIFDSNAAASFNSYVEAFLGYRFAIHEFTTIYNASKSFPKRPSHAVQVLDAFPMQDQHAANPFQRPSQHTVQSPPPAANGLLLLNLSPNPHSKKGAGTPNPTARNPSRLFPHP